MGRFAPSPTGPLHFGSLVAAVGSWLFARSNGGRWLVRMEDLDAPRVVPGAADDILRALERYGLDWDGEVVFQSGRTSLYEEALPSLRARGLVFDCACSRVELQRAASAPDARDAADAERPVYPGTCRGGIAGGRVPRAMRFRVRPGVVAFDDAVFGHVQEETSRAVGDFVVKRADGPFRLSARGGRRRRRAGRHGGRARRGPPLVDGSADPPPARALSPDAAVRAPAARARARRLEARQARRRAADRDAHGGARRRDAPRPRSSPSRRPRSRGPRGTAARCGVRSRNGSPARASGPCVPAAPRHSSASSASRSSTWSVLPSRARSSRDGVILFHRGHLTRSRAGLPPILRSRS